MRLKCTAIIDHPGEMEKFVRKLQGMGLNPAVVGNIVYLEYKGYNKAKYNLIIDIFEDRTRHTIDTRSM